MRALVNLACRKYAHHAVACAVCALLLFFAVGTKLAWYHPHERGAKSIASTKVWQATDGVPVRLEQTKISPHPFALAAMAFAMPQGEPAVLVRVETKAAHPPANGFFPFAIRPPPAC